MKKLTDEALLRAFVDTLGVTKAAAVMGWAVLSAVGAPPNADRRWFRSYGLGSSATRWRRVEDLLQVRRALLERGYDLSPEGADKSGRIVLALAAAGRAHSGAAT